MKVIKRIDHFVHFIEPTLAIIIIIRQRNFEKLIIIAMVFVAFLVVWKIVAHIFNKILG